MRGWWQGDDGRLYHDTLTERVLDMLAKKEKDRLRQAEYRVTCCWSRSALSRTCNSRKRQVWRVITALWWMQACQRLTPPFLRSVTARLSRLGLGGGCAWSRSRMPMTKLAFWLPGWRGRRPFMLRFPGFGLSKAGSVCKWSVCYHRRSRPIVETAATRASSRYSTLRAVNCAVWSR